MSASEHDQNSYELPNSGAQRGATTEPTGAPNWLADIVLSVHATPSAIFVRMSPEYSNELCQALAAADLKPQRVVRPGVYNALPLDILSVAGQPATIAAAVYCVVRAFIRRNDRKEITFGTTSLKGYSANEVERILQAHVAAFERGELPRLRPELLVERNEQPDAEPSPLSPDSTEPD
jgi:hypothetical protein